MIRAASREAMAQLESQVDSVAGEAGVDALSDIANDLYQVAAVLGSQPQLRRMLGDASSAPEPRSRLIERLFDGKIDATAQGIAGAAVALRWSTPWDLVDGIELSGDRLLLDLAERQGQLDAIEDDLFRFGRILEANDALRGLLDDQVVPGSRRAGLLRAVLEGKVDPVGAQLLSHAVQSSRKRTTALAIDDLLQQAAARRHGSTALVQSAIALTDEQISRLAAGLGHLYGRAIDVRSEIDPAVRGGLRIRVGDEIIDGSVAGRLTAVRSALAS